VTSVRGAIEGRFFDTFECTDCRTVFAWPLEVPAGLYEAIYQHADRLPGYARYVRYARRSQRRSDALKYLAEQEDMYWAVARTLDAAGSRARSWRIAEVGSGLGYLTHALRSAGHNCVGLDISETAVAEATERFGPWYQRQDVFEPTAGLTGSFDLVILLETLEHVPDPAAFLAATASLVRPDGSLLVTTPNRDSHPSAAHWRTDLPPVHLYWFTEQSLARIAEHAGFTAELLDFSDFNAAHEQTIALGQLDHVGEATLDSRLQPSRPIPKRTAVMERLREIPILARIARALYDRSRPNRRRLTTRSFSMAVLMTRRSQVDSI
jgi:SAM-dependent methyltransferase